MDWRRSRRSTNVEDRRGSGVSGPLVGGGLGTIVIALIVAFLGGDPSVVLDQAAQQNPQIQAPQNRSPQDDQMTEFVSAVLGDTEDTWGEIFTQNGERYVEPKLVIFSDAVQSGCGVAQSSAGPFYCSRDQTIYIDLEFYRELRNRFQAPGDFAQAYVIAHEVGHHVQNITGTLGEVNSLRQRSSEARSNELSVRLELQADCYAGVWGHHADRSRQILEQGDIEEAINAASAIGDDRIQQKTRGYVDPESFSHGSSQQRARWFTRGLQTGDPNQCDTFSARNL